MKKYILAAAAIAALAAPAGASAFNPDPAVGNGNQLTAIDENLRLEGQFVDVAANADEGFDLGFGARAIANPFGPVLDSDVRYREESDNPTTTPAPGEAFDRQQLEWKASDLRIEDPNSPNPFDATAIDAPDGTQVQTDVYQSIPGPTIFVSDQTLMFTNVNLLDFIGTVNDDQGNPLLTTIEGGEAQLKAQFRNQSGSQETDDIPDISEGECAAVVLVVNDPDDQNDPIIGTASAVSLFNDQTGANC